MLIQSYTALDPGAGQGIDLEAFGYVDSRKQRYAVDEGRRLLYVWGEESGLALWRLGGEKLFELPGACAVAMLPPEQELLWVVLRLDDEHIECRVYSLLGEQLAALRMDDEIYRSHFILAPVSCTDHVCLQFGGGQDGCKDVFLRYEGGAIHTVATLCKGYAVASLCFAPNGGQLLALEDSGELLRYSYPQLELLQTFIPPEEDWQTAYRAFYIDGERAVIGNAMTCRWYVLELCGMCIAEEIEVAGHPPKEDDMGVAATDIEDMRPDGGKLRMSVYRGYKQPRDILLAEWPF